MFDINQAIPYFDSAGSVVALTATPKVLVPNQPQRAILIVTAPTTGFIYMWLTPGPLGPNNPQVIVPASNTMIFTWELHGALTTWEWYASSPTTPGGAIVTQVFFRPTEG
jgi:hypothetical protein